MNDTAFDTMVVPEFIHEATRRFEESPRTYQIDGADALLPPRAVETRLQARAFVNNRLSRVAHEIDRTNRIPEERRREIAELVASDVAMEVVTDAMQFWGGAGYMVGSPVERMYRDAKIIQIYEGANEIQELVIARAMQRAVQDG